MRMFVDFRNLNIWKAYKKQDFFISFSSLCFGIKLGGIFHEEE